MNGRPAAPSRKDAEEGLRECEALLRNFLAAKKPEDEARALEQVLARIVCCKYGALAAQERDPVDFAVVHRAVHTGIDFAPALQSLRNLSVQEIEREFMRRTTNLEVASDQMARFGRDVLGLQPSRARNRSRPR